MAHLAKEDFHRLADLLGMAGLKPNDAVAV